jgi:hypothetical protein
MDSIARRRRVSAVADDAELALDDLFAGALAVARADVEGSAVDRG